MRLLLTILLMLAPTPAFAQQTWVNHFTGLPSWKSLEFYPDPAWGTGANGPKDNKAQINSQVNASGANLLVMTGFAVPNPTNGAWGVVWRAQPYSGHTVPITYFKATETGSEGELNLTTGVPSRNAWYMWDFYRFSLNPAKGTVLYWDGVRDIFSVHAPIWFQNHVDVSQDIHIGGAVQAGPNWKRGYSGAGQCGVSTTVPTEYYEGLCVIK